MNIDPALFGPWNICHYWPNDISHRGLERNMLPKRGNQLNRFEPGIFPRANFDAFGVLQLTEIAQDTRPAPQAVEICTGYHGSAAELWPASASFQWL
jgi:hypothetical protein